MFTDYRLVNGRQEEYAVLPIERPHLHPTVIRLSKADISRWQTLNRLETPTRFALLLASFGVYLAAIIAAKTTSQYTVMAAGIILAFIVALLGSKRLDAWLLAKRRQVIGAAAASPGVVVGAPAPGKFGFWWVTHIILPLEP